jgi:hypothetical protein
MRYYAELDTNKVVVQVITGVDDDTIEGVPAADWYSNFVAAPCVETWIDRNDKTYAGIGYTYSYETQDFIQPYVETVEPADEP